MAQVITVSKLIKDQSDSLGLSWVCGDKNQTITRHNTDTKPLAGYLNPVRPFCVTLFGHTEINYWNSLEPIVYQDLLEHLWSSQVQIIIVAKSIPLPKNLSDYCTQHNKLLLTASARTETTVNQINQYLNQKLAQMVTMHGVLMEIFGLGVLLTGTSGVGKSELALELIDQGHRLIADDAPLFTLKNAKTIVGTCPPILQDFLEVRGLGILNIRAMFGDTAIKLRKQLNLIIKVVDIGEQQMESMDRLYGIHSQRELLKVSIPEVSLPIAAGRSLAIIVEGAVRNHTLKMNGYNAWNHFTVQQEQALQEDPSAEKR